MIEPYDGHWPVVHATAYVHPQASVIGKVTIGPQSSIWPHATLRGDEGEIIIGARTSIQDSVSVHCYTHKRTVVGDQVTVGHNAVIHGAEVESDCVIGLGALLLDDCRIGRFSVIAAGSLIAPRVVIPPRSLVFGAPGRVRREVGEKELHDIEYGWQRYLELMAAYQAQPGEPT